MNKRIVVAALGVAALAVPAAAVAGPSNGHGQGKGHEKAASHVQSNSTHGKGHAKTKKAKKIHTVMFVFKGVYKGAGVVTVAGGNNHARRAGYIGKDVTFDLSTAKLVVADTDGAAGITETDLQAGDVVLVQARLPRAAKAPKAPKHSDSTDTTSTTDTPSSTDTTTTTTDTPAPIVARKVVDKTHPPVNDGGDAKSTEQEQQDSTPAAS